MLNVRICKNGDDTSNSRTLQVAQGWRLEEFLGAASLRLSLESKASFVFDANGQQVEDLLFVNEGDLVFLSAGEAYRRPSTSGTTGKGVSIMLGTPGDDDRARPAKATPAKASDSDSPSSSLASRRRRRSDTTIRVCGDYVLGDILGKVSLVLLRISLAFSLYPPF